VTETIKTWQVWTVADSDLPEGVNTFLVKDFFESKTTLQRVDSVTNGRCRVENFLVCFHV
jgi:hypothetical protein